MSLVTNDYFKPSSSISHNVDYSLFDITLLFYLKQYPSIFFTHVISN